MDRVNVSEIHLCFPNFEGKKRKELMTITSGEFTSEDQLCNKIKFVQASLTSLRPNASLDFMDSNKILDNIGFHFKTN